MKKQVYVELDGKRRFIGMLEDGGTLYIERDSTKHLYRNLNSYGMDEDVVLNTLASDCREIHLTEKDTGVIYRIPLATFKNKAIRTQYKTHGAQLQVPLKYWYKQP